MVLTRWTAIVGFALVAIAALAIDRRARRAGSQLTTLATVLGRLMLTRGGRIGMLVVWWWLGWHFLAR